MVLKYQKTNLSGQEWYKRIAITEHLDAEAGASVGSVWQTLAGLLGHRDRCDRLEVPSSGIYGWRDVLFANVLLLVSENAGRFEALEKKLNKEFLEFARGRLPVDRRPTVHVSVHDAVPNRSENPYFAAFGYGLSLPNDRNLEVAWVELDQAENGLDIDQTSRRPHRCISTWRPLDNDPDYWTTAAIYNDSAGFSVIRGGVGYPFKLRDGTYDKEHPVIAAADSTLLDRRLLFHLGHFSAPDAAPVARLLTFRKQYDQQKRSGFVEGDFQSLPFTRGFTHGRWEALKNNTAGSADPVQNENAVLVRILLRGHNPAPAGTLYQLRPVGIALPKTGIHEAWALLRSKPVIAEKAGATPGSSRGLQHMTGRFGPLSNAAGHLLARCTMEERSWMMLTNGVTIEYFGENVQEITVGVNETKEAYIVPLASKVDMPDGVHDAHGRCYLKAGINELTAHLVPQDPPWGDIGWAQGFGAIVTKPSIFSAHEPEPRGLATWTRDVAPVRFDVDPAKDEISLRCLPGSQAEWVRQVKGQGHPGIWLSKDNGTRWEHVHPDDECTLTDGNLVRVGALVLQLDDLRGAPT